MSARNLVLSFIPTAHKFSASIFRFLFLMCLATSVGHPCGAQSYSSTTNNFEVEQLKVIQQKVAAVVAKNMNACVSISDGVGSGSGVIISESGLVLTAGHVISENGNYKIHLPTGGTVNARRLGKNLDVDSGLMEITDPGPWPHVEISKNRTPTPGEWVVSLGHSGGFELGRKPPVRTGRVLSVDKHQVITDAVLIGGDSGGPLFDLDGKLIAIHSSIGDSIAENRHVTMATFARDWDRLKKGETWGSLPELNEPGKSKRKGRMGITVDLVGPTAKVKVVKPDSPAEEAGIRPDDIVFQFGSVIINDGQHLIDLVKTKSRGEVFPIVIIRNGKQIQFEIQLR